MLNVLITLLATALLTCSTGVNSLKETKETFLTEKVSLKTEPKRAYYNPSSTYGTTEGNYYNYAENANASSGVINNTQSGNYLNLQINGTNITPAYDFPYYDWYADGQLITTTRGGYVGSSSYYTISINLGDYFDLSPDYPYHITNNPQPYLWIFDHQEPDPIQEMNEGIFEAVGDTITGLSDALARPWNGILNIFYDTTENEVTQMGYLVLIGLGISITLLVFWTILRLFKQRN